jgi:hypothetical protein
MMMNGIDLNNLSASAAALFIAGFWSVLFAAFRETGNAGILRLAEKKPQAKASLQSWSGRWNLLRTTLRFCLTLFEITAIYFAFRAFSFAKGAEWIGLMLIMTPLYLIFIRVIPFVLAESYADRLSLFFPDCSFRRSGPSTPWNADCSPGRFPLPTTTTAPRRKKKS